MRIPPLLALVLSGMACSSSAPTATVVLIPGQEADAFTRDPKPTRLEIRSITSTTTSQTIASMPWPVGGFDIGDLPVAQFAALEAIGSTTSGDVVVRGRTLPMAFSALDGSQIPLFMGRVGEMARPPGLLPASRSGGVTGIVDGQLLIVAGGTEVADSNGASLPATSAAAYDLGLWSPLSAVAALPRAPSTMAIVALRYGLLIDAAGATWVDFDTSASTEAQAPAGMSFADVSGAVPVQGQDGISYLVGATRPQGAATVAVLKVNPDLTLSMVSLTAARVGAAATWVAGKGLLVVGGSGTAAGAEMLESGSAQFAPLAVGALDVSGGGVTALDASHVLLAGGVDQQGAPVTARLLDPSCVAQCDAQPLVGSELARLDSASVWALSSTKAVVVGTAPSTDTDAAQTRVVVLSINELVAQASYVPLREPRLGARATALPTGTIAVTGGKSPSGQPVRSIELFTPPS